MHASSAIRGDCLTKIKGSVFPIAYCLQPNGSKTPPDHFLEGIDNHLNSNLIISMQYNAAMKKQVKLFVALNITGSQCYIISDVI